MSDPILSGLTSGELKQIEGHAAKVDASAAPGTICTPEMAALSLLQAHLVLMRDCENVLPDIVVPLNSPPVTLGKGIGGA